MTKDELIAQVTVLRKLLNACTSWESWERECNAAITEIERQAAVVQEDERVVVELELVKWDEPAWCVKWKGDLDKLHMFGEVGYYKNYKVGDKLKLYSRPAAVEHPVFGKMEGLGKDFEIKNPWTLYETDPPLADDTTVEATTQISVDTESELKALRVWQKM